MSRVVDLLIAEETTRGAWNLDIGMWGPVLLRPEAEARVLVSIGRLLELRRGE